ncbi:MAG: hypothetical protein IKC91_02985 [Clostridia bacterium]|nr:hypothetical protein [Clostridia bacterium]
MIAYILYICIVLFLTYLGYFLAGKHRLAKKFYASWDKFHQFFLSEVEYTRRPLDEVLKRFEDEGDFSGFLKEYRNNHKIENSIDFLSKEENEFLKEYFSFLGKSDYTAQREYFNANTKKLNDYKLKSEQNAVKYTDLYVKLGFLLGLIIVILLI